MKISTRGSSNSVVSIESILNDITILNVDCIVNAAHEALMGGGGVDGAIHRAAGPSLLQECRAISQVEPGVRCRVGEACITSGGRLLAKYVIHTVAPKFVGSVVKTSKALDGLFDLQSWSLTRNIYKNAKEGTDEDLAACYENCIKLADSNNITSIAFPSLGTGGHAYPIEIAAPIAVKTTIKALEATSSINRVYFVCYSQSDYDIYEQVMKQIGKE
jgi:O-acetyl-ADP-ribose deacetylase (regulator of RNase III)